MRDAELNYVDGTGRLWRIVAIHGEPTVIAQEIESASPERVHGGISGAMWNDWKRIHRPEARPKTPPTIKSQKGPGPFDSRDWHYDSQGYCDNPGRGY